MTFRFSIIFKSLKSACEGCWAGYSLYWKLYFLNCMERCSFCFPHPLHLPIIYGHLSDDRIFKKKATLMQDDLLIKYKTIFYLFSSNLKNWSNCGRITILVRRFAARPCGVSLLVTGLNSPRPAAAICAGFKPY